MILATVSLLVAIAARAETCTVDGVSWIYAVSGEGEVSVKSFIAPDEVEDLVIPSELDGYSVVDIGGYILEGNSRIKSVTIPNTVRYIMNSYGNIGGNPFRYALALEEIKLEYRNKYLYVWDGYLYANNPYTGYPIVSFPAKSKRLSASIATILPEAFQGGFVEEVNVWGIGRIGRTAFQDCTCLRSLKISGSISTIEESSFQGCVSLPTVELPSSVTKIEASAFNGCTSLSSVSISTNITSIGAKAFYKCALLPEVIIPSKVTSVGSQAFADCANLKRVEHWGLKAFDPDVLSGVSPECTLYVRHRSTGWNVQIPGTYGNVKIDYLDEPESDYMQAETQSWTDEYGITWNYRKVEGGVQVGAAGATLALSVQAIPKDTAGIVRIPAEIEGEEVVSIAKWAFYGCAEMTELVVPPTVSEIGIAAFAICRKLTSITFEGNAPASLGGTNASIPSACVVWVQPGTTGWDVEIPGTWKSREIHYVPCEEHVEEGGKEIVVPMVCDEDGGIHHYCAVCNEYLRYEVVENTSPTPHVCVEYITKPNAYKVKGYADYKCKFCDKLVFSAETPADWHPPNGMAGSSTPIYSGEGPYYEMVDGIVWRYYVTEGVAFVRYEDYWTPAIPIETAGDIIVPERLGHWPLTMLRESPFINCENLTSVTIPACVTNIEGSVFYVTRNLKKIIFLGDAPRLADHPFYRTWATVYAMPGSKGWNVPIPGVFPMGGYDYEEVHIDYYIEDGKEAAAKETLKSMQAANPLMTYWDCYVAGLNADDENASLKASIEIVDGKPVVSVEPDLGDNRVYTTYGSTDLKAWVEVTDGSADNYRFFKVGVSTP